MRHERTIILDEMQRLGDAAQILKIAADDLVRQDSQRNLDLHNCRAPIHDNSARPPRASARSFGL